MTTFKYGPVVQVPEEDRHGPFVERRQSMQQMDKLRLQIGLMNDALLHVEDYNLDERTAMVATTLAILSRL